MQIPILNGIYTDEGPDFRVSYPTNLIPIVKQQGISAGYLRPAHGIEQFASVPGLDRGGINWNNACYRVCGTKLIRVDPDGSVGVLGDVAGSSQVGFDYSFDRLAIASNNNLFYWDGATLTQVTDPDLGVVIDMIWVDGYFMTTDGDNLVVTELSDPTQVNPLKYGSSEADPDPIKAIIKVRNEPYVLNRYTIEVFDNIGGDLFPFERVDGAQIQRGTIGTHSCCLFLDSIAFLGGGRNENISVWIGVNGASNRLATEEIDQILGGYSEGVLSEALLEAKTNNGSQQLYIHLPDQTLVYDATASQLYGQPVWFVLTTALEGKGQYRAKNHVWCYDKWIVGDPQASNIGTLSDTISTHWGLVNGWEFGTLIFYNEGRGAIFHEIELVCLTGRGELGADQTVWTQYSLDGETWSQERAINAGARGNRAKRLVWLQQGPMRQWRIQRFRGTSDTQLSVARLEARVEGLNV